VRLSLKSKFVPFCVSLCVCNDCFEFFCFRFFLGFLFVCFLFCLVFQNQYEMFGGWCVVMFALFVRLLLSVIHKQILLLQLLQLRPV